MFWLEWMGAARGLLGAVLLASLPGLERVLDRLRAARSRQRPAADAAGLHAHPPAWRVALVRGPARTTARPLRNMASIHKLSRAHFAFMRALAQGIDLRTSWQHYLGHNDERDDLRTIRSAVAWIRGESAAAAKRQAQTGTARRGSS